MYAAKKAAAVALAVLIALSFISCGEGGKTADADALFKKVCSADEALDIAKRTDAVVIEKSRCTSGKDAWEHFYEDVSAGKPASVVCAHYYTLERDRVSDELYEAEKDGYPKTYLYRVEFDGEKYSVTVRDSKTRQADPTDTFRYLIRYTGENPSTALYRFYDKYVLVNDPSVTWEDIVAGMVSSQSDAGYKHCTLFSDSSDQIGIQRQ